jgi:rubredoxin
MKQSVKDHLVKCKTCGRMYIPYEEGSPDEDLCASCEDTPEEGELKDAAK